MGATYYCAGAGSGKTHKLTHILADKLVKASVDASGVILTTFTKAAAADFVRKAREVLINEKHRPDKAAELDGALIGTVHSVCERFIRKYWFELGLTLPLNILSEEDKNLYMSRTAEIVADEDDVLFFSEFAREFKMNEDFWKQALTSIINGKYGFGIESLDNSQETSLEFIDGVFSGPAVNPDDKNRFVPFIELVMKLVQEQNTATGKKNAALLKKTLSESVFVQASLILSIVNFDKESVYTKDLWNSLVQEGTDLIGIVSAAGRYVISREIGDRLKECTRKLFALAEAWEKEYRDFKTKNGLLDFNDLEQRFIDLLTEEEFESVRKDIRDTYKLLMVDEFQDSNPVQIRIFRKLMALVDETIFVGDDKQAIYGFRGTERSLVNDFITKEIPVRNSLRSSYRSRPELVEAANDVFCDAVGQKRLPVDPKNDSAPYDGISLNPERKKWEELNPAMQHWTVPLKSPRSTKLDYSAVGKKIRELKESGACMVVRKVKDENGKEKEILDPIRYGDIAILLRYGTNIGEIAQKLRESGVPVSIQEKDFLGWAEVQLVLSLIRYIINPEDGCAKADIMHLIGGMPTEEIIINAVKDRKDSELFKRLDSIRSRISVLSVSEIVDSLALVLDMYGNTASWGLPDTRIRNLDFLTRLARDYEQLCENMNTAPSLPGFIGYVSDYKTDGHKVDRADTVKVITCHGAKGLEWPMVILDELDSLDVSAQEIAKKEIRGVHSFRKEESDQVQLLVFPEIYCKKTDSFTASPNIPEPIVAQLKETAFFKYVSERKIEEERNLLYVAFTRAKDYLITLGYWKKSTDKKTPEKKSSFSWPKECNACINGGQVGDQFLLWHAEHPSKYYELPLQGEIGTQQVIPLTPWRVPEEKTYGDKYISPSRTGQQKPAAGTQSIPVVLTELFCGDKMIQNIQGDIEENDETTPDDKRTICGTCIHRIFAAYDPARDRAELVAMAGRIIAGMGLTAEFPSPESVVDSAAQFFGWLRQTYGDATALHELPFVKRQPDGTVVRGEMDLVWELPGKKCILVDYKSFHGSEELGGIKAHAVRHGYPAQLKTYKETLEAGGYKVQDVLIYYFVQGRIVKFEV